MSSTDLARRLRIRAYDLADSEMALWGDIIRAEDSLRINLTDVARIMAVSSWDGPREFGSDDAHRALAAWRRTIRELVGSTTTEETP